MNNYETILAGLSRGERLAQLAEEGAELSQAALKLRRSLEPGTNPTPLARHLAENWLREEIADALLCMALAWDDDPDERLLSDADAIAPAVREIMAKKLARWADRLRARGGDGT